MSTEKNGGWIGVDLDGTLAFYDEWRGVDHIGEPIPAMVARVKSWIEQGVKVKIFTARVHGHGMPIIGTHETADVLTPIRKWCVQHIGRELAITNQKDFGMFELWDDRCVQVIPNTGQRADEIA